MNSRMLRSVLIFLLGFGLLGAFASDSNAQTISELPYNQEFRDVTIPNLPDGWIKVGDKIETSSAWTEFATIGYDTTLQFPPNFTVGPMGVMPEIDAAIDITTLELTFAMYAAGTIGANDVMRVGFISDDGDPAGSFTLVEEIQMSNAIEEHTVSLASYTEGNGRRIAFYPESHFWNRFVIGYVHLEAEEVHEINIVHNGGFETWVDDLPLGWVGVRNNLPLSGINQYTTATHSGASAVQLVRESGTHARFTTQPLSIQADTEYSVSYWVRGSGEIRNAFYRDGGYSGYTGYTAVDSDDWQLIEYTFTHGNAVDDVEVIFSVRNTTNTRDHLQIDGVSITFESDEFIVMPPALFPGGDIYTDGVEVTVYMSAPNSNAVIYYTDDGSEPTVASAEYEMPLSITTATTLKAIARADDTNSAVTEEAYVFDAVQEVTNIAELRQGNQDGTIYQLTNEVFMTMKHDNRNQKWIQDASGAILIDDNPGTITTDYNIGDGITGLTGTLASFGGVLQFVPDEDPGAATSTGNVIEPFDLDLGNLTAGDQSRLVRVQNALLSPYEGNFEQGTNYTLTDKTGSTTFRTGFADTDIPGKPIYEYVDALAIVTLFQGNPQLQPRMFSDIAELAPSAVAFGLTSPVNDVYLDVDGEGDTQVVFSWAAADSDFPVTYYFHVDTPGGDFSDPLFSEIADGNGMALTHTTNMSGIDEFLEDQGVAVGDTAAYIWTITAHIGDNYDLASNDVFTMNLVRGLVDFVPYDTMFELAVANDNLPDWMGASGNTERGITTANGYLYVLGRRDALNLFRVDSQSGEVLDTTTLSGASGGDIPINDIGTSGDGVIYGANLTTNVVDRPFRIYQISGGTATQVIEFSSSSPARLGDKFTVVGNWNDGGLTIYAADASNNRVFKWTMENGSFGDATEITLEEVLSGGSASVSPLPNGDFYWNAGGNQAWKFDADGNTIGAIPSSAVPFGSTTIRYLGTDDEGNEFFTTYLFDVGMGNISVVMVPEGVPEDAEELFRTPALRVNNPVGLGDVSYVGYEDGVLDLYLLSTNNALAGYTTQIEGLELPDYSGDLEIISIAEARALDNGRLAIIKGVVNSEDFGFGVADYFIQDGSVGLKVTDFDNGGAQKGSYVTPGDSIVIIGEMGSRNNERRIVVSDYVITSSGNDLPEASVITAADWYAESEYQGTRVQLRDMYIIAEDLDNWPDEDHDWGFTSGINIRVTSDAAADTFIVRMARNGTPWENGADLPPAVFHVSGTMGQYSNDTQLFPFFVDDFQAAAEIEFANLQGPPAGEISQGSEYIVYSRVRADGFTDNGETNDIKAWIGVNSENVAPWGDGWTWIRSDFNSGYTGSGHEYMTDIGSGLDPGTYYYASRFQLMEFDYEYGGFEGGFWDGENNVSGQLTVNMPTDADMADIPREFGIDQNYPNPFNPATNIRYAVPQTAHVTIQVYSVTGQLVATLVNETRDAGYHDVVFDGSRLASGVYIYRMQAADFVNTKKLMLIK